MSLLAQGYNLREDLEVVTVFGLLQFGAAAALWDDETFFHRTGIALRLHADKNAPSIKGLF